jgi:hypothetical protein
MHCWGSEILTKVDINNSILWDIRPCSPLKVNQRFGGNVNPSSGSKGNNEADAMFATCFIPVSHLAYTLILKMDTCSSETSIDFRLTTHYKWAGTAQLVLRLAASRMTEGSEFKSRLGQEFFPLHVVQTDSGAHSASYVMGTGELSPRIKRPGREAYHSPPTSAEVKKTRIYTSTPPYVFMA